jgi:hypothetical protein
MTTSGRLSITELSSTQNNRSVTVNEAIAKLEQGGSLFTVEQLGLNAASTTPTPIEGDTVVIGQAATGDFSGQDNNIALYHNSAWMFLPAIEGMMAYAQDEDRYYRFDGSDWLEIPIIAKGRSTSDTSVTPVLTDASGTILCTSGASVTFTVPPESSVSWPDFTSINVCQMGTGTVTFAAGAGVTLNSSAGLIETANQYALAAVFKTGTNEWLLTGDIG